ncbi:MAG TPA: DUF5615 family PIN-like protein [Candidatus Bathyarchaeia archaeon]|nr:DUF5615 family PIN-like protein [Candidatus Bathyarchaeia archaeon]
MRIQANENVPLDLVEALRQHGHDVEWVRAVCPGAKDKDLLERAQKQNRLVLTFDKDFGELAFRSRLAAGCGIVLLRIPLKVPAIIAQDVVRILESRDDWIGHFSVIDDRRIRMVPLP